MVSQFKQMPNALPDKYLSAFCIPKRETIGSSNPYDQSHTNPQITGPPPPFDIEMSDLLDTSPSSVPCSLSFGMNRINNLISQMPDQLVLNIQCQSSTQIRSAIQLLSNWLLYKRTQDNTITSQQLALQLVAIFSGLASKWWRWIPQESREEMLNAEDADQQILTALGKEFYGLDENEDYEQLASLFMSARICDLNKSEEYFCYMQKLLISFGNADKPAYLKHYLRSFLGHVPDAAEQHLKDKNIPLAGLSLAQLHGFIMETWQEHCLEKRVAKYFKRHSSMFSLGFCKDVASQIGDVVPTIEDTLGVIHVVVKRKSSPSILVHLDFIPIKATNIKKKKQKFQEESIF